MVSLLISVIVLSLAVGSITYLIIRDIYKRINYYPRYTITIDISKKQKMDNNELLDYYIINYGIEKIESCINEIKKWKNEKLNSLKESKKGKFLERCKRNETSAFTLKGIRTQTRYSQVNYQRYSYKVNVVSNTLSLSEQEILNRISFLKEHDFNVTYNNYNKLDQRKALTKELRQKIIKRDNYTCQICGKFMPDEVGLHVDHIIPVSKGGKSIPENLRVLCSKCNGSKGNKLENSTALINNQKSTKKLLDQNNENEKMISSYNKKFFDAYFNLNYDLIEDIAQQVLQINTSSTQDCISLHFLIVDIINRIYSLKNKKDTFELLTINLCKKDIENYEILSSKLNGCEIITLTRLCIIYEKNNMIQEAIDLCNLGINYNFADSGKKNFIFRKERLIKHLTKK